MNNVQDIEAAFNSQEWDQQIELDLGAGRLDWLANEAMADLDDELIWVWIGTHAQYDQLLTKNGAGGTRTHGLRFRKPSLYPAELQPHGNHYPPRLTLKIGKQARWSQSQLLAAAG